MKATEETIFHEALGKQDPQERMAYLEQACGADDALRKYIEQLLLAYRKGAFLESPANALEATSIPDHATQVGMVIGPYKLLEQIGEGGMGLVYMAEQQRPVRRLVALKVVKPEMESRQVINRFEAERQALAMMDHPNIAHVLDAGTTETGSPYFVMELVRGLPINEFCDQKRLTVRQRLELFIQVCQAVQHAHQKGIIHRDLKPTNVLVTMHDTVAVPKVIDFGIAKALGQQLTDHTLVTGYSQLIGTPLYMSPEQADMNQLGVDTRSDVYSLGVMLYELLTGHTPFEKETLKSAGFDEMRRIIREEEPLRPSRRVSTLDAQAISTVSQHRNVDPRQLCYVLRGDIDWIVLKCLEKDRNRRYDSASALAADVQRYLADELVEACPPTAAYRVRSFVRRYRRGLVTAMVIAAALLVGTGLSAWQAFEAIRERDQKADALVQKEKALEDAKKEKQRAETNLATAHAAVERFLTRVGKQRIANEPRMTRLRRELLEDALQFYLGFLQETPHEPTARHEAAQAFHMVAVVQRHLGQAQPAEEASRRTLELLEPLVAEFPDEPRYQLSLARQLRLSAMLHEEQKRPDRAEACFRQSLALVEHLAAEHPQDAEYAAQHAEILRSLGVFCSRRKRNDEAEPLHRKAVEIFEHLAELSPRSFEYRRSLAQSRTHLAISLGEGIRVPEVVTEYETALRIQRKLLEEQPDDTDTRDDLAGTCNNLALVLQGAGRLQEAATSFREAAEQWDRLTADYPAVPHYAIWCQNAHHALGVTYQRTGEFSAAGAEFRRALAIVERRAAAFPSPDVERALGDHRADLARFLCTCPDVEVHKPADALRLAQEALAQAPQDGRYWRTLGMAQYRSGQSQEAVRSLIKCIELRQNSYICDECFFLAMAQFQLGNQDEARQWFERGVTWMEKHKPVDATRRFLSVEAAELLDIPQSAKEAAAQVPAPR